MTIVKLVNGKYEAVDTVPTERGARTMTVDQTNSPHLSAGRRIRPAPPKARMARRAGPPVVPDSFHVLVVGK